MRPLRRAASALALLAGVPLLVLLAVPAALLLTLLYALWSLLDTVLGRINRE